VDKPGTAVTAICENDSQNDAGILALIAEILVKVVTNARLDQAAGDSSAD